MSEKQFEEASAAIEQAITAFVAKIDELSGKWDEVSPASILEGVMLALSENITALGDELKPELDRATLKLLDAMSEYVDSIDSED